MLRENYYDILGVTPQATTQDIRKAYTTLALQYHPDKNESADAREKFEAIQRAYETLIDDKKRAHYDALLRHQFVGSSGAAHAFTGAPAFRKDRESGGTIITGDGWSFAINLNNISVSKLVFTFADDADAEDPHVEHIVLKTQPGYDGPPETYSCRHRRFPDRANSCCQDPAARVANAKSTGAVPSAKSVPPQRPASGRKSPATTSTTSQHTLTPQPSSRSGGVRQPSGIKWGEDKSATANMGAKRKKMSTFGDRMKSGLAGSKSRNLASTTSRHHVASCARKNRMHPYSHVRDSQGKTNLNPLKLNLNTKANFGFPPKVNVGSRTTLNTGMRTGKPRMYAIKSIVGKLPSPKSSLMRRKSTALPVRPTIFAARSRLFHPTTNRPDSPVKRKAPTANDGKKKGRK